MKNWEDVEELLMSENINVIEIVEDYSGRGMFGNSTTGLKLDDYNFKQACALLDKEEIPFSSDNMGLNYIIY